MQIANPMYDTVFKFLMEDSKSAILLLSAIIGEEIESLDFLPQENIVFLEHRSLTVYRLDFSAKIKTGAASYKQVLIEIQKAKFATDIMRFRRYLGEQYGKKENKYHVTIKRKDEEKTVEKALPIVTVYFLGYSLENTKIPVIKVNRRYYDVTTDKEITVKEEFIESLTHDSYVIQIPHLRKNHQTGVEQLLAVFDQKHTTPDVHFLDVDEKDYPEECRPLIRRLQKAASEPEVRRRMDIEDDILEELQDMERAIEKKDKALEANKKTLNEKDKALDEKDKVLGEKDKALGEKDKALETNKKALDKKDKALDEKDKIIEELRKQLS
ncbi:MAG: hypothetical protein GY862_39245 [Gammaproteobacteria bacterium]|nr:hypothetical protein [Gammaproteobacteria bacterium]